MNRSIVSASTLQELISSYSLLYMLVRRINNLSREAQDMDPRLNNINENKGKQEM